MAIDFSSNFETRSFRERAISQGKDPVRVDRFIRQKRERSATIDLVNQGALTAQQAVSISGEDILPDISIGRQLSADEKKNVTKITNLESNLTLLEKNLSEVGLRGPIAGRLGEIAGKVSRSGEIADFEALRQGLIGQVARVISGEVGTMTDQDIARAEKMLPSASDSIGLARRKLENLKTLIDDRKTSLGIGLPAIPGKISVSEKGNVTSLSGTTSYVTKEDKDSNTTVEGRLVKWLADSEFLPIAGSIVGGLAGAGAASIATGAAGALAGKAIQQGLRELLDPDRQDLSDAAKAVVTEGLVDAIFGGVFLGLGKAGKLVLSKALKEPLEAVLPKMARTALKPKASAVKGLARGMGIDFGEEVIERGVRSLDVAQEIGEKGFKESMEKLNKLLAGKTAKTSEVAELLNKIKSKSISPKGVVSPAAKAGASQIDETIKFIKSFGKEIPADELNKVKRGLQQAFSATGEVSTVSKKVTAEASREVRKFVEKFSPEIAGTNKEIAFNRILKESAKNVKLTAKSGRRLLSFTETMMLVGGNFKLLAALKALNLVSKDLLTQAQIIKGGLEYAQSIGDRELIRNFIRVAMRAGVVFSASSTDLDKPGTLPSEREDSVFGLPQRPQPLQQQGLPQIPGGGGGNRLPPIEANKDNLYLFK